MYIYIYIYIHTYVLHLGKASEWPSDIKDDCFTVIVPLCQ